MGAFDDFQTAMGREAVDLIESTSDRSRGVLEYRVGELVGQVDDLPEPELPEFTPREQAVRRLFLDFNEISESVESLQNVEVYVRRFPYSRSGIDKAAYLRYHVENYLNELYILQQRLDAYLKVVARIYKTDPKSGDIRRASEVLRRYYRNAVSGIVSTRGAHVHQRRYDDEALSKLALLSLLSKDDDLFAAMYEGHYRQVRKAKREWIQQTNASILRLLDSCFGILNQMLLDETGRLRSPEALPNTRIQQTAKPLT